MDKKKMIKYVKIVITCLVVGLFLWFLVISPYITFKKNEKTLLQAGKRYYEINSTELPTGSRIATVTLKTLAHKAFVKGDFYVPYSSETCNLENSWVKVKKENNQYKYYVYLECGVLKSKTDHQGPQVILNGNDEITINKGEEYQEPGVKKVTDNQDGNIDVKNVIIHSDVDTNTSGTYEVTYTVYDNFRNKTVKVRKVNVVEELKHTVEQSTDDTNLYKGGNVNNYVLLSNILFRIVGIENDNVKVVAARDIANVNYDGIEEWLKYFENHLAQESKALLVKNAYCQDKITETPEQVSSCATKTKERYSYILSLVDMNNSLENNESYLYSYTISWLMNETNDKEAWTTRNYYFGYDGRYMSFNKNYSFGVRPVLTIKGKTLIKSGDGTLENPYSFKEIEKAKADDLLNTRYTGEYITYSGYTWRIIESELDGTTKVILDGVLPLNIGYDTADNSKIYNPSQKGNVGYYIKNKVGEYVDPKYFDTKEIAVPIYKNYAKYNNEKSTKTYKVKFAAPSLYDVFSTFIDNVDRGYWLINSSTTAERKYAVSNIGTVYYTDLDDTTTSQVRVVGYLNKKCKITGGFGTKEKPYKIKK